MITASAEAGVEEAIQKLISMYQAGEGVKRDYNKAISWQRGLAELRREAYLSSDSLKDA